MGSIDLSERILLWCGIVNYAALIAWFIAFACAHRALYRLHSRWFRIPEERFDALHYGGMAAYKVAILVFNVAPYVALCVVHSQLR